MECKDPATYSMDELLDFAIGEGDDDEDKHSLKALTSLHPNDYGPASFSLLAPDDPSRLIPDGGEEELEWLSNKDAFPQVESFTGIPSEHHHHGNLSKHHSPVSVLENSTSSSNHSHSHSHSHSTNSSALMSCYLSREVHIPVRARSNRQRMRRRDIPSQQKLWWCLQKPNNNTEVEGTMPGSPAIGRKCQHCGAEKTPQWRAGPYGPKTLCNACGVRYKSGRLVPEYRPASSPTFSNDLHSNSHRKIMEMRRQKHVGMGMGMGMGVKSVDKG